MTHHNDVGSGLNTQFATGGNEHDASALYVPDEDGGVGTPSKTNSWFTGAPKGTPAPTLSAAGGWAVLLHSQAKSNDVFQKMQNGGKVGGQEAWAIYATCGLPTATLSSIWKLSDVDGDQFLDAEEFALMAYVTNSPPSTLFLVHSRNTDGVHRPPTSALSVR